MPRLRNASTGAVVSCSDETAARLGSEWRPVEVKPLVDQMPQPKPVRRSRKSK